MIRADLAATLNRLCEPIAAGGVAAIGLWIATLGGLFFVPLGLLVAALGAGFGVIALRRLRFAAIGEAPGVVEVVEGQITYLGPEIGGMVGLPDLVELRLLTLRGRRFWRLKQADGQALLIPVEATGAERLYDAFASLPGIDTAALVAALHPARPANPGNGRSLAPAADGMVTLWQRRAQGVLYP